MNTSSSQKEALVALLIGDTDPNTLLSRCEVAEKSKEANVPVAESSLASWASRGTGPEFLRYGNAVKYRWGTYCEWLANRMTVGRSTSEHRIRRVAA